MAVTVTRSKGKNRLQRLDFAARKGLTLGGLLLVQRASDVFARFAPRGLATGQLARSLTVSPVVFSSGWYVVSVGPTVDYGWWVHQGRGPGKMPAVDAIYDWLVTKKIPVRVRPPKGVRKFTKRVKPRMIPEERARWSLAFMIAKKIGAYGTQPFPFLLAAYLASKDDIKELVISEVVREMRR